MNTKLFISTLLAGMLLALPQCKKDTDERVDLYSAPSTNKLTCKIDGQRWEATEVSAGFSLAPPDTYYFRLDAYKESTNETIEIYLNKPYSNLERKLNQYTSSWYYVSRPSDYGSFDRYNGWGNSETYITNAVDTGYCTITYIDSVRLRIKGVFAFTARDEATGKTIRITDGYFERVQGK